MNINIDLDEKISEYYMKNICNENFDITSKINDIVSFLINKENIICDNINVTIESASKEKIKKINKEYRNIDSVTDVLSFPLFTLEELNNMRKSKINLKEIELGDIIICLDIVNEHSNEYCTGFKRELLYMITHGMCHLLGYDHIEDSDKKIMRALEEEVLDYIGVSI